MRKFNVKLAMLACYGRKDGAELGLRLLETI